MTSDVEFVRAALKSALEELTTTPDVLAWHLDHTREGDDCPICDVEAALRRLDSLERTLARLAQRVNREDAGL